MYHLFALICLSSYQPRQAGSNGQGGNDAEWKPGGTAGCINRYSYVYVRYSIQTNIEGRTLGSHRILSLLDSLYGYCYDIHTYTR